MPPTTTAGLADGEVPAPVTMFELLVGFELSQALYTVAKCDIATALVVNVRSRLHG